MNSALLLSNALALAVLLGFHFAPESGAQQVAQRMPHYLQVQKAPQLAVLSDRNVTTVGREVSEDDFVIPAPSSERLVF